MKNWIYLGIANSGNGYTDHEFEIEGDDSARYILTLDTSTGGWYGTIIKGGPNADPRDDEAEGMDADMVEELKGQIS